MKIGILQTGHVHEQLVAENGDYPDIFARFLSDRGFEFVNYAVVDGHFPEHAGDADGWLITGSKYGAYDELSWIAPLETLIRAIYADGIPLVGVCFGHQIIAQALGGKVEKFDGGWSVGRQEYTLNGKTFSLNAWHQDQVVALPPEAKVVSSTDFCANAAILYGGKAFTIQPHPEINRTYLKGLLDHRAPGIVPEPLRRQALDQLDQPVDEAPLAEMITNFFREKSLT